MANAEEKKEPAPLKDGETPSMEEILQSIRGVISGDDASLQENPAGDDVLELIEAIEEVEVGKVKMDSANTEKSILDDIDAALDDGAAKVPEVAEIKAVVPPPAEDKKPEVPAPEPTPAPKEKKPEETITPVAAGVGKDSISISGDEDTLEADINVNNNNEEAYSSAKIGRLLNKEVAKQSSVPLQELVNSIHDKHVDSPNTRGGTSLEDLVIEAMKPFLAEWLNKNLPIIVRKIVAKEVKRLIPREEEED
jgi:cell pole-organizing protein PopZ